MVFEKPVRFMLPNNNESDDDVKVAPKPKLQVGHHPIQQEKVSQINIVHVGHPGRFRWRANFAPSTSPTKLPDTTSREVCPRRGGGLSVESGLNPCAVARLAFHQAQS